jgi:hypothetical protein
MPDEVEYADPTQWMFQFNPDWYDLGESAKRRLIEQWAIYRHRNSVRVGQRIYFMQTGGQYAAVTAIGRIGSLVYEKPHETDRHLRYWVDVVYDAMLIQPLTRPDMQRDLVLAEYAPLAVGVHGTGFRLPANVAARLERLVSGRLRPIGASAVAEDKRIFLTLRRGCIPADAQATLGPPAHVRA